MAPETYVRCFCGETDVLSCQLCLEEVKLGLDLMLARLLQENLDTKGFSKGLPDREDRFVAQVALGWVDQHRVSKKPSGCWSLGGALGP